jgi:hypothetical protein
MLKGRGDSEYNTSIYINEMHRWLEYAQGQNIGGYDSTREGAK